MLQIVQWQRLEELFYRHDPAFYGVYRESTE